MSSDKALRRFQEDLLNVLTDRIRNREPNTIVSLPPGTGKAFLICTFLNLYFRAAAESSKVLVITPSRVVYDETLSALKKDLIVSVGNYDQSHLFRVVVEQDSKIRLQSDITTLVFDLVICVELNENSFIRLVGTHRPGFPPVIAFVRFPYSKNERIGDTHYVYSFADAIKDGFYRSFDILKVDISKNESEKKSLHDLFSGENIIVEETAAISPLPQEYLRLICADLVKRVRNEKTLIISSTIAYAETLVEILNTGNKQGPVAGCIHSKMSDADVQRVSAGFEDPGSKLKILVIVEISAIVNKSKGINHLVPLTKNNHLLLRTLAAVLGNSREVEVPLHLYDYTGISDRLKDYLNEDFTVNKIEEIKVRREVLSETPIVFRDKKNIDPVLGVEELAEELADIIKIIPGEQGSMIGVFGNWGRGKTFLMDLVWKALKQSKDFTRIDFHAWKYQDTPATWAYLYELFAEAYFDRGEGRWYRPKWLVKEVRKVYLNILRQGFLPIGKFLAVVAVGIVTLPVVNSMIVDLGVNFSLIKRLSTLSVFTIGAWAFLKKDYSAKAKDIFLKYSSRHSFKDHLGLQAEIQKEMLKLVKCWIPKKQIGKKKLILFVDDIDRCSEAKVIQIIDALRVLLEDVGIADRVVVFAAVDERFLRLAIKSKYAQLMAVEKKDPEQAAIDLEKVTGEYMDKLFISGIKLGSLSSSDRDDFMLSLTKADRSADIDPRKLNEIVSDEQRIIDSRMSPDLKDLLIQDALERQQEEDYIQDLYLEGGDDYIEEYHPEYLDRSEQVDTEKIVRDKGILAEEEVEILRYAAIDFGDVTPRQMRIFYYRYLMAKNLIARRYYSLKRTNIWIRTRYSLIVAKLIIHYSGHQVQPKKKTGESDQKVEFPLTLQQELNKAVLAGHVTMPIGSLNKVIVNAYDYSELLKILDVVIAY